MNSAHNPSTSGNAAEEKTPAPDLQPEDAGTPASGNSGRGTAAEGAMKQFAKTEAESGTSGPAERPTGGDKE